MKSHVEDGGILVTREQQSWVKTQLVMQRLRPLRRKYPPGNLIGNACFRLAHRRWFDPFIMVCIVLNTIIMAMEYFGQGEVYTR